MKIVIINNKEKLNGFLEKCEHSIFLQSWEWGEFQEKTGNKVIRLGVEKDGALLAVAALIKKPLFLGKSYFYSPRGPIVDKKNKKAASLLFEEIKKIAKKERAIFLRFEPGSGLELDGLGLEIKKTIDVQPSKSLILELEKSENELLSEMHQKTRYNIRLAEKKAVKIIERGVEDYDCFWRLANETKDRDNFRLHSKEYYCQMLECACPPAGEAGRPGGSYNKGSLVIKLFMAEYEDKIIAANLASFFGDTITYMHGASGNESRNVMAPYLLQWHCIKLAKSLGYKYYDFYGINEKKWPGVTRFKKGFGGEEINYPGTFDLIFDKTLYSLYNGIRKIRRII